MTGSGKIRLPSIRRAEAIRHSGLRVVVLGTHERQQLLLGPAPQQPEEIGGDFDVAALGACRLDEYQINLGFGWMF